MQIPTQAPPPVPPRGKFSGNVAGLLACGAVGIAAVLACHALGFAFCPLKRLTGIPCPSCGTTRACLRLLHGDWRGALAMQPLAMVLLFAGLPAGLLAWALLGRQRLRALWTAFWARWWAKALAAAVLLLDWAYVIARGN